MDKVRFEYLLKQQLDGKLTADEQLELQYLLEYVDPETQQAIVDRLDVLPDAHPVWTADDKERTYTQLAEKIAQAEPPVVPLTDKPARDRPFIKYLRIAALFALIGFCTPFLWKFWQAQHSNKSASLSGEQAMGTDIYLSDQDAPAIELPDGRMVNLGDSNSTSIASAALVVQKDENGDLVYSAKPDAGNNQAEGYYTFHSAKGRTSRLVLTDGTEITLNSASTIRYPKTFTAEKREVLLEGEAYFDVAHERSRPFFVKAKESIIKVLGTSFNVAAYLDEDDVTATLIEGSVNFSNRYHSVTLKPGEQVISSLKQEQLWKKMVDVEAFTLWKEGYFMFEDQSVQAILTTVKRWYDIDEITYETAPSIRLSGTFKRSKSLNQLLKNMQKIGNFTYKIKGRRVVVMQ